MKQKKDGAKVDTGCQELFMKITNEKNFYM